MVGIFLTQMTQVMINLINTFGYITFSNQDNRNLVIMLKTDNLSVLDENTSKFQTSIDLVENIPSGKWRLSSFAVLDKIGNQLLSPNAISDNKCLVLDHI